MYTFQAALVSALIAGSSASPVLKKRDTYAAAIEKDFPDPSVMQAADGEYYAFATSSNGVKIQVATSSDSIGWTLSEGVDALAAPPSWADQNAGIWAPDVTPGTNGIYNMFFAATNAADGKHCLGFATSQDSPTGPYTAEDEPWQCDENSSIDPDQFLDEDGTRWVTWKIDGNSVGSSSTPIILQQVQDDGHTKVGDAVKILDRDDVDGPLIEAPSLNKVDGTYYLTFSSNYYNTQYYDTSFATATSIRGPYTKAQAPNAPILATGTKGLYGPGGADIFIVPGQNTVMLFHGWDSSDLNARYLYATSVGIGDGKITVNWG